MRARPYGSLGRKPRLSRFKIRVRPANGLSHALSLVYNRAGSVQSKHSKTAALGYQTKQEKHRHWPPEKHGQ